MGFLFSIFISFIDDCTHTYTILQDAFVDVTLACDGKSFPAHKVVLSACSPYFQVCWFMLKQNDNQAI